MKLKSNTKKKAREARIEITSTGWFHIKVKIFLTEIFKEQICLNEQISIVSGSGKLSFKKLNKTEEKLMALVGWTTVTG